MIGDRCTTMRNGAVLDGAYQIRWLRDGDVSGVLSLNDGRYMWTGSATAGPKPAFHFVEHPHGAYTVEMQVEAAGLRPSELPDGTTVARVRFAPNDTRDDPRRVVEVRVDQGRHILYMHSIVSEVEMWSMQYDWAPQAAR